MQNKQAVDLKTLREQVALGYYPGRKKMLEVIDLLLDYIEPQNKAPAIMYLLIAMVAIHLAVVCWVLIRVAAGLPVFVRFTEGLQLWN